MEKLLKKNTKVNGITLIALVITIIVLLILAGISISMLSGDNALLSRVSQAKEDTEKAEEKEIIKIAALDVMTKNKSEKINEESLKESLSRQTDKNFDIYTTEGKIRVIFTENNTYYDLDSKGNVNYIGKAKKGLDIGDYVTYIPPEASYLWDGKYSGEGKDENEDGEIDKTEIKNTDSNYSITKWRVLNINGSKVDLVAREQTVGKVYLTNPQGYNNAVKLLNDACSTLYANKEKGITARSIRVEDFEDKFKKETLESIAATTATYNGEIVANYNNQQSSPCRSIYSLYPKIYAEEYRSVINGVLKKDGLKRSEQISFIEPDIGTETDWSKIGRINTATSIQPYFTYYKRNNEFLKNDFKKQIYYDILIRSNSYYTSYWIASRNIYTSNWSVSYHIYCVIHGKLESIQLYVSYGAARNECCNLLPIVTINTDLLTENEDTDNWIIK